MTVRKVTKACGGDAKLHRLLSRQRGGGGVRSLILIFIAQHWNETPLQTDNEVQCTEIGKKAWLFAKLQPGRARKRINAT